MLNAAPEVREQQNKKTVVNQQAQGAGKSKPCNRCVPHSPRAVRHNLTHKKTDLGVAKGLVQNKIGCDVLFTKPVAIYFSLVNVPRTKGKGAHRFVVVDQALFPLPDFNGGPNESISRLPDATRNLRAPKGDKTHTQPLEHGA